MRNKQKTGFTLIELLVVIATITLLSSIVLVTLKGAREKSQIAKVLQWARSVKAQLGGDIVGDWNFNEGSGTTAYDATGYNNGTLINGVSWTDGVQGLTGKALYFDGINDYVDVGSAANLFPSNITLEAWVKTNAMPQWEGIISNMTAWGTGFSLQMGTAQNIAAMVSGAYLKTSWVPSTGIWYHVAATHDAATNLNILYVNGKKENSVTRSITYEASPKTYIGMFYTSPSLPFNGTIDEVRIYNRALTAMEIQKHYAESAPRHGIVLK